MPTIKDVAIISLQDAKKMAEACDFLVPVLVSGGGGIEHPGSDALKKITNVKTKKILYICGSDTPRFFDADNILSKELGVALNAVGKKTFPVVVPIDKTTHEMYLDREIGNDVAQSIVLLPMDEPPKTVMATITAAHKTTLRNAPDARIFWAHMAAVLKLYKAAPAMFIVEAGSAYRGGDQLAYYLNKLGAVAVFSMLVAKRDKRDLLTYNNFDQYAKLTEKTPEFKKGIALATSSTSSSTSRTKSSSSTSRTKSSPSTSRTKSSPSTSRTKSSPSTSATKSLPSTSRTKSSPSTSATKSLSSSARKPPLGSHISAPKKTVTRAAAPTNVLKTATAPPKKMSTPKNTVGQKSAAGPSASSKIRSKRV